jgi:hypothetical protein
MPGLIDIVSGAETVEMQAHSIAVRGLSIEGDRLAVHALARAQRHARGQ